MNLMGTKTKGSDLESKDSKAELAGSFEEYGLSPPTARKVLTIKVEITADSLLKEYSRMLVLECARMDSLLAKELKLTQDEVMQYCEFLVQRRISIVEETITDFHKVRQLFIPYWIESCLAQIGKVWIRELGYLLVPVYSAEVISLDDARVISDRLSYFQGKIEIAKKVMPKEPEGSRDVMSMALLANEVAGLDRKSTPQAVAITRFLGLKLLQESVFDNLYRVNYGDLESVTSAVSTRKIWMGRA